MAITPTSLSNTNSIPSSPLEVRTPQFISRPDWSRGIRVRNRYRTTVNRTRDGNEQRRIHTSKPAYGVDCTLWGLSDENRIMQTRFQLERHAFSRGLAPLYADKVRLTNVVSTTLSGNFADRRFFAGGRVALLTEGYMLFGIAVIQSVSDSQITIDALPSGFGLPGIAVPLSEVQPILSSQIGVLNGMIVQGDLSSDGVFGPQSLESLNAAGSAPGSLPTWCGKPIWWRPPIDWSAGYSERIETDMDFFPWGIDEVPSLYPSPRRMLFDLSLLHMSRDAARTTLDLWGYASGRGHPFYWINPTRDLFFIEEIPNGARFYSAGTPIDFSSLKWLVQIGVDPSFPRQVRTIDTVTLNGDYNDITFVEGEFCNPGLARRYSFMHLVRFAEDELVERWETDEVMRCDVSLVECAIEDAVTIPNIDATTDTTTTCSDTTCSGTTTTTTTTTTGTGTTATTTTTISFTPSPSVSTWTTIA